MPMIISSSIFKNKNNSLYKELKTCLENTFHESFPNETIKNTIVFGFLNDFEHLVFVIETNVMAYYNIYDLNSGIMKTIKRNLPTIQELLNHHYNNCTIQIYKK